MDSVPVFQCLGGFFFVFLVCNVLSSRHETDAYSKVYRDIPVRNIN